MTDKELNVIRLVVQGQTNPQIMVSLDIDTADLGDLHWEPSRGGALFPHLYGSLAASLVHAVTDDPLRPDGVPDLGVLA